MRLLPGRKVPAFLKLVEVDQLGKRPFGPTPRGWIQLVREDAQGHRDRDAFGIEIPEFVLPIETGARKRRVGQPGDCNVVEDVVAREALRLSVEDACDKIIAARVVIQEISRQPTGESTIPYIVCGRNPNWKPYPIRF